MTDLVNTMAAGVLTRDEHLKQLSALREARKQGHNFIKIKLNENFLASEGQSEVKFNGVKAVRVYPSGLGRGGLQNYEVVVSGGELVFRFTPSEDPENDGWYASMLDDQETSIYDPNKKGYNRDFLASHFESGQFIILDAKVKRDIVARAKLIKEHVIERNQKNIEDKNIRLQTLKEQQHVIKKQIELEEGNGGQGANNKTDS